MASASPVPHDHPVHVAVFERTRFLGARRCSGSADSTAFLRTVRDAGLLGVVVTEDEMGRLHLTHRRLSAA